MQTGGLINTATGDLTSTSFPRTQGEAPSQYYVPLAGFFVNKYTGCVPEKKPSFIFELVNERRKKKPFGPGCFFCAASSTMPIFRKCDWGILLRHF